MVYCDFIKAENNKILYKIGGTVKDITGQLTINSSDGFSFEITKQPDNSKVSPRHIEYMIRNNIRNFKKKLYPEKMSYEI